MIIKLQNKVSLLTCSVTSPSQSCQCLVAAPANLMPTCSNRVFVLGYFPSLRRTDLGPFVFILCEIQEGTVGFLAGTCDNIRLPGGVETSKTSGVEESFFFFFPSVLIYSQIACGLRLRVKHRPGCCEMRNAAPRLDVASTANYI